MDEQEEGDHLRVEETGDLAAELAAYSANWHGLTPEDRLRAGWIEEELERRAKIIEEALRRLEPR